MADVGRPGIAGCPGLGAGRLSFSAGDPCPRTGATSRGLLERGANGRPAPLLHLRGGTEGGRDRYRRGLRGAGDGPLYIFLSQTEPIGSGAISYLRAKTYEYLETVESWHPSGPGIQCFDHTGDERRSCFDNVIGRPTWDSFGRAGVGSLPRSRVYEDIVLDVGGVEARRTKIGWASWRQLWPAPGPTGASGASSGFDVSDVDTTNIPDLDCEKEFPGATNVMRPSCRTWTRVPETGVAGKHTYELYSYTIYVQVKSPVPENEAELDALTEKLVPDYKTFTYKGHRYEVEIIPVKYDFGQLRRWSVILDRFALSAGNTIGIVGAIVNINTDAHATFLGGKLVWMNGVEPAGVDESRSHRAWPKVRNILVVYALDPDRVASALPELLPLLGIPIDAVGLVAHADATPMRSEPLGGEEVVVDKETLVEKNEDLLPIVIEELVGKNPLAEKNEDIPPLVLETPEVTSQSSVETSDSGSKPVAASRSNSSAEKSAPGSETATEPDSSTVSPAKSGGEVTSVKTATESKTGASPEPETDSVAIPNRGDSGGLDAPSADATVVPDPMVSRWVLVSVGGAVALAVAGSVVFVGVRRVRRRA